MAVYGENVQSPAQSGMAEQHSTTAQQEMLKWPAVSPGTASEQLQPRMPLLLQEWLSSCHSFLGELWVCRHLFILLFISIAGRNGGSSDPSFPPRAEEPFPTDPFLQSPRTEQNRLRVEQV